MIEILKIIAIALVVMFTVLSAKRLADNFNEWRYERKHRAYLRAREECKKEQERKFNK